MKVLDKLFLDVLLWDVLEKFRFHKGWRKLLADL
jgi:hypothetical protein